MKHESATNSSLADECRERADALERSKVLGEHGEHIIDNLRRAADAIENLAKAYVAEREELLKARVSEIAMFDRAQIMERVESYFGRVRKLGGDTGECSAAGVADFLMYRAETDNFAPSIALPSATFEKNQCDGCARGLPTRMSKHGTLMHDDVENGMGMPVMACTADRYVTPSAIGKPVKIPPECHAPGQIIVTMTLGNGEWYCHGCGASDREPECKSKPREYVGGKS